MTTILDAATSGTIRDAAYAYLEAGCSIVPLQGKQPTDKIRRWLVELPTPARVGYWLDHNLMHGIGVIAGPVSGGLVVIDFDSMDAVAEFESAFPSLTDTLTVRSGSGRGRHYYFYSTVLPFNIYRGGVELRASGAYVVAPPSLHPVSLQAYRVENITDVQRVFSLASVRRWIQERGNGGAAVAPPRRPTNVSPHQARTANAYGRAALSGECAAVAHAPEGQGNNTLYRAALKLGSLIAGGNLDRAEVERELEAAAAGLSARDGVDRTRRTIASGLNTGIRNGNTRRSVR